MPHAVWNRLPQDQLRVKKNQPGFLSTWFVHLAERISAYFAAGEARDEPGTTVRYRMTLVGDIQGHHAEANRHMRTLLDACRDKDTDKAIECMQRFALVFRQIGLTRSVLLCPYLRWGLQRDHVATVQFESTYRELMQSTLLAEVILSDYLGSPWDSDRQRRFVHVVVRLASLFSRGVKLETTVLLPLYLPPRQYSHVVGSMPGATPKPGPDQPDHAGPAATPASFRVA